MTSNVYFKFKSSLEYESLPFDGVEISVADLKKEIQSRKLRGKLMENFDLTITNAQTREDYKPDGMVPKNTSVIVARIPVAKPVKRDAKKDLAASPPKQIVDSFSPFEAMTKATDLPSLDVSEEKKVELMIEQSNKDFANLNYSSKGPKAPSGPVPQNYVCHKCGQPGHFIQNCPKLREIGPQDNFPRLKRSTGIPNSFMRKVDDINTPGVLITSSGQLAVPAIDAEAYKIGKKEKPPFLSDSQRGSQSGGEEKMIPKELLCPLCKDLLIDAVVAPCCGDSACDECIRGRILESSTHTCPLCEEKNISPDGLIANRFMRTAVNNFQNEVGYTALTKRQQKKQQLQQPPKPVSGNSSLQSSNLQTVSEINIGHQYAKSEIFPPQTFASVHLPNTQHQISIPNSSPNEWIESKVPIGEATPVPGIKGARMVRVLVTRQPVPSMNHSTPYAFPPPPLNYPPPPLIPQQNATQPPQILMYPPSYPATSNQILTPHSVIQRPSMVISSNNPYQPSPLPANTNHTPFVQTTIPLTEEEFYREKQRLLELEKKKINGSISPDSQDSRSLSRPSSQINSHQPIQPLPSSSRNKDIFEFVEDIMYKKQSNKQKRESKSRDDSVVSSRKSFSGSERSHSRSRSRSFSRHRTSSLSPSPSRKSESRSKSKSLSKRQFRRSHSPKQKFSRSRSHRRKSNSLSKSRSRSFRKTYSRSRSRERGRNSRERYSLRRSLSKLRRVEKTGSPWTPRSRSPIRQEQIKRFSPRGPPSMFMPGPPIFFNRPPGFPPMPIMPGPHAMLPRYSPPRSPMRNKFGRSPPRHPFPRDGPLPPDARWLDFMPFQQHPPQPWFNKFPIERFPAPPIRRLRSRSTSREKIRSRSRSRHHRDLRRREEDERRNRRISKERERFREREKERDDSRRRERRSFSRDRKIRRSERSREKRSRIRERSRNKEKRDSYEDKKYRSKPHHQSKPTRDYRDSRSPPERISSRYEPKGKSHKYDKNSKVDNSKVSKSKEIESKTKQNFSVPPCSHEILSSTSLASFNSTSHLDSVPISTISSTLTSTTTKDSITKSRIVSLKAVESSEDSKKNSDKKDFDIDKKISSKLITGSNSHVNTSSSTGISTKESSAQNSRRVVSTKGTRNMQVTVSSKWEGREHEEKIRSDKKVEDLREKLNKSKEKKDESDKIKKRPRDDENDKKTESGEKLNEKKEKKEKKDEETDKEKSKKKSKVYKSPKKDTEKINEETKKKKKISITNQLEGEEKFIPDYNEEVEEEEEVKKKKDFSRKENKQTEAEKKNDLSGNESGDKKSSKHKKKNKKEKKKHSKKHD